MSFHTLVFRCVRFAIYSLSFFLSFPGHRRSNVATGQPVGGHKEMGQQADRYLETWAYRRLRPMPLFEGLMHKVSYDNLVSPACEAVS
jgi:hypothetical protein